jgi:hypothetical protein
MPSGHAGTTDVTDSRPVGERHGSHDVIAAEDQFAAHKAVQHGACNDRRLCSSQRASCARRRRKRRTRSRVWARTTSIGWRRPSLRAGRGCNGRSLMTAGPAVNAPRSVSHFTFGRRKICEPHLAKMRDENASHRMDQPRRPGRAWPALVGCRDVQIGPHAQRGNQLGLDAVRMALAGPPALRPATAMAL